MRVKDLIVLGPPRKLDFDVVPLRLTEGPYFCQISGLKLFSASSLISAVEPGLLAVVVPNAGVDRAYPTVTGFRNFIAEAVFPADARHVCCKVLLR